MRAIGPRAHRRSRGHTHRRGRFGVTLRVRDFFQLVETISFNVRKTARKEPITLPSRASIDAVHRLGRQRDAHAPTLRNRVHVARILDRSQRASLSLTSTSGAWFPLSVDALWAAPTHELRRDTTIWFNPSFYRTDLIGALIQLAH